MLGVHGDFAGRGLAKEMMRFALELAKTAGMKAVRLDVLRGNVPAEKLYEGEGFTYVDTIKLFYEDTGRVDFKMYEYVISRSAYKYNEKHVFVCRFFSLPSIEYHRRGLSDVIMDI